MAHTSQEATNLPISAFRQRDLELRALTEAAFHASADDLGKPLGKMDAPTQLAEYLVRRLASHPHAINLANPIPGVRQPIGQFAIVRDQDQPFAGPIEAPHGKQAFVRTNEIDHSCSTARIMVCTDNTRGFIHQVVGTLRMVQGHPVDPHSLPEGIDSDT
jgi:hypothetical protein